MVQLLHIGISLVLGRLKPSETAPTPVGSALLLETGDYLLLETGDRLLLE